MYKFFITLLCILIMSTSTSFAAVTRQANSHYTCGITAATEVVVSNNKRKIDFTVVCNSPYGYRAYIVNPMNGAPIRDIASGDGPVNHRFTIYVTEAEFWAYQLYVMPALN